MVALKANRAYRRRHGERLRGKRPQQPEHHYYRSQRRKKTSLSKQNTEKIGFPFWKFALLYQKIIFESIDASGGDRHIKTKKISNA